jgi:hypothetical protein
VSVATHNTDAQQYAAHLLKELFLLATTDPHSQTRHFFEWIDARLKWEAAGILASMTTTGEPVRGLCPHDSDMSELDTWAN